MPTLLNDHLLAELESRWRVRSPGLLGRLLPGIDDDEIDRLTQPLGFILPEEARRWYRWHDGAAGRAVMFRRSFRTLSDDVAATKDFQEDDELWRPGWLQVMDDKPYVIFDCGGDVTAPVPVWHFDYSFDFDRPSRPVFASIGDMVTFWLELIDNGQLVVDTHGEWDLRQHAPAAIQERIRGVPTD